MKNTINILYWIARGIAALIMLQTLYFKFTASPESVEIFSKVGMEPWGRIGVGILELIASALILVNRTAWLGALLAIGLMAGAIVMHFTVLGIVVQNDGGYLFLLAVVVMSSSIVVLLKNRTRLVMIVREVFRQTTG